MNANELMIGNLLRDKVTKTELKVIELTEKDVVTYVIDRSKFPLQKGWGLEPIPITEEWLLRFGFFKYNNAYVLEKPSENIMNFKFSIWNDFTYNSSEFPVELKSVHQLQNLYFCLCGTHLTLK